jgi:uncharacterized protein YyaL (SSP411 family)
VETLLRLAVLTGESQYERRAVAALRPLADLMSRHPSGFGRFLCALDFHVGAKIEIALVGPSVQALAPLAREVFGRFLPARVVAGMAPPDARAASGVPLLEGRTGVDGKPTAYVCRDYACELPVTESTALATQIEGA